MPVPYDVRTVEDVQYRETPERSLALDLYLPDGAERPRPAVALVHGGGWEDDHRGMFGDHLAHLAAHGYVGADVTHRLSGQAVFPAAVRDLKAAVAWLRRHADEYGVDPARVALGGHSSGAHLAALVAATPGVADLEPDVGEPTGVDAVVPMNGPYDLDRLGRMDPADLYISGFIERLFGATRDERPDAYRRASVHEHLTGDEPPVLVMTSTEDGEVPFEEATRFHGRLLEARVEAELEVAVGGGHLAYTANNPFYEEGVARMHAFLDRHL